MERPGLHSPGSGAPDRSRRVASRCLVCVVRLNCGRGMACPCDRIPDDRTLRRAHRHLDQRRIDFRCLPRDESVCHRKRSPLPRRRHRRSRMDGAANSRRLPCGQPTPSRQRRLWLLRLDPRRAVVALPSCSNRRLLRRNQRRQGATTLASQHPLSAAHQRRPSDAHCDRPPGAAGRTGVRRRPFHNGRAFFAARPTFGPVPPLRPGRRRSLSAILPNSGTIRVTRLRAIPLRFKTRSEPQGPPAGRRTRSPAT